MSHVVSREQPAALPFQEAAAGPARFDAPPRRVWFWKVPSILDAGLHGRPILRRGAIALVGLLLAAAVLAPDLVYGQFPTYELTVVDAAPRSLPGFASAVAEVLPEGLLGYSATYRLPAGGVRSGPISADEYARVSAGETTMPVHVSGGDFPRGLPASGRFERVRLAAAGICLAFGLGFGLLVLIGIRRRWWMVRLARKGTEVVGRVTEVRAQRLVHKDEPVAWVYDVYYEYPKDSSRRQDSVTGFLIDFHLPWKVDDPIRLLQLQDKRPISIPCDLLPTARRTAD